MHRHALADLFGVMCGSVCEAAAAAGADSEGDDGGADETCETGGEAAAAESEGLAGRCRGLPHPTVPQRLIS